MNKFRFSKALLPLFFIFGCSVKEVRDGCPCRLLLDMTSVDKVDQSPFTLFIASKVGFEYSTVMDGDICDDTCVVEVPRTKLDVVLWSGDEGRMDNNGLVIPFGQQCPRIYMYATEIDADGELIYNRVALKKNYCLLSVSVEDPHEVSGMKISGGVDGFDKLGRPHCGEFSVFSPISMEYSSSAVFSIPRQDGGPLYLELIEPEDKIRRLPLHDYIFELGYDWMAKDLNDLNMVVSYTPVGVTVNIKSWDEELIVDVVI